MRKLIVLMLMVGVVNAATIFNLNDRQVIETHLSNRDFNRIAIDDDRITQVFYDRESFNVVNDTVNGQIFVKPVDEDSEYPLSLTITTENNKTQDWLFTFKNVKARTLILQEDKREIVKSLDCKEQAVKLLNKLVKNENVKGMVKNRKNIPVTSGWKLTRLKYVKLGNFIGHTLSLKNTTNQAREIKVKELWRDELVAISLDRPKVESGDYVRVIMVTEGQGLPSVKHVNNTTTKKHEPHPLDWYVNRGDV